MENLSQNAVTVLERRYYHNNETTPEQMFRRVAQAIAAAELNYDCGDNGEREKMEEIFYNMMINLQFLPNSPTLMNAGRDKGQLAACFVLPIEDSMEGIFDTLKYTALIHKSGGGTGFSFSRLRPKNSKVGTTGGVASGPVSFMKIFNTATEQVKQGGTRRGANMAILRVDHPDILEFIGCKDNNAELTNFNISVGVTDAFMEAVREGRNYDLINPTTMEKSGELSAREVWEKLIRQAWKNGDPGIIFLDKWNQFNPTPAVGEIESTNPCGEQGLLPNESCNLGSVNLAAFVNEIEYDSDGVMKETIVIDWDGLKETVHNSVRFLDNVIDICCYPLEQIDSMTRANRKIGLGVMGFADLLYRLGIAYNSIEGIQIATEIMLFIQSESRGASAELAKVRGVFPNYENSVFRNSAANRFRNATTTTIAPTGTLSIIADCSGGIEPTFALSFVKTVMDGDRLVTVNPWFEKVARERNFYSPELMDRIAKTGSIQGFSEIPEDVRRVFVTAHDVSPEWHVRMQAAFQKYTDNGVSKTVNLPHGAMVEDVRAVYQMAYDQECKGVTIYRDGSKEGQVLSLEKAPENIPVNEGNIKIKRQKKPRLGVPMGPSYHLESGCGTLYIDPHFDADGLFECFVQTQDGGCDANTRGLGMLLSYCLRHGADAGMLAKKLMTIKCPACTKKEIRSCPAGIGKSILMALEHEDIYINAIRQIQSMTKTEKPQDNPDFDVCPDCGERTLRREAGCVVCPCGFSKC